MNVNFLELEYNFAGFRERKIKGQREKEKDR